MNRSYWTPPVLAVSAGLLLLLATAAGWVDSVDIRDVGGVAVNEPVSTSGTAFAPAGVVLGLAAVAAGAVLAVLRGTARRAVAGAVALIGIGGIVVVALGLQRAAAAGGRLSPAPLFAAAAAVGVATAGIGALRGAARPPAASRYRVADERAGDDEWTLASAEDESGT